MNLNPMCCGDQCRFKDGPVKVYPLGSGGNLILCSDCWRHENDYRRARGYQYNEPEKWPVFDWEKAESYEGAP